MSFTTLVTRERDSYAKPFSCRSYPLTPQQHTQAPSVAIRGIRCGLPCKGCLPSKAVRVSRRPVFGVSYSSSYTVSGWRFVCHVSSAGRTQLILLRDKHRVHEVQRPACRRQFWKCDLTVCVAPHTYMLPHRLPSKQERGVIVVGLKQ